MSTDRQTRAYVVGFLFSPTAEYVALIEKQRPLWQAGRLNGIGGKIELGESALKAMRREFRDEAGADIETWRLFATMTWRGELIHFFVARAPEDIELQSLTDERVAWYRTEYVVSDARTLPNLRWLIPLALDADEVTATVSLGPDGLFAELHDPS